MAWLWWVGSAVALIVVEVLSLDLVLVMFAGGALAAGGASALGADLWLQVAVFGLTAALLLFALRPYLLKHLRMRGPLTETNIHARLGSPAVVVAEVGPTGGRIKFHGEVWSARAGDEQTFHVGETVVVERIDGATAVVVPGVPEELVAE